MDDMQRGHWSRRPLRTYTTDPAFNPHGCGFAYDPQDMLELNHVVAAGIRIPRAELTRPPAVEGPGEVLRRLARAER